MDICIALGTGLQKIALNLVHNGINISELEFKKKIKWKYYIYLK